MLSGVWQLLFNPFHDLPEGGSVEGVSIPAGPHNLIPAQQHMNTHFYLSTVITSPSFFVCILFFLRVLTFLVMLVKSQMQQDESGLLFKSPTLHSFIVSPPPSIQSHHLSYDPSWTHTLAFNFNTFYTPSYFTPTTTHISLGANSGASILYPSFMSL